MSNFFNAAIPQPQLSALSTENQQRRLQNLQGTPGGSEVAHFQLASGHS